MSLVLVDTSIWVEVLRKKQPLDLEALVSIEDVVTCLPIVQEVFQGIRDDRAFGIARDAMAHLPHLEDPLERTIFDAAVDLYRLARKQGLTIRSSTDCLIAACAVKHGVEVLHRDRDYSAIARVSSLRQREP